MLRTLLMISLLALTACSSSIKTIAVIPDYDLPKPPVLYDVMWMYHDNLYCVSDEDELALQMNVSRLRNHIKILEDIINAGNKGKRNESTNIR